MKRYLKGVFEVILLITIFYYYFCEHKPLLLIVTEEHNTNEIPESNHQDNLGYLEKQPLEQKPNSVLQPEVVAQESAQIHESNPLQTLVDETPASEGEFS